MLSVIILLFEFVILTVFNSTGTRDVGNAIASIFVLIHALMVIASFNQNKKLKNYSKYLIRGFMFRVLLLFVDVLGYPAIVLPNKSDDIMFYANAVNVASGFSTLRGLYPKVMGTLFQYIGTNKLFGQYVSMLCAIVALAYLTLSLVKLDLDDKIIRRTLSVVCILPNFAILSSLFMREAIIYMFLSLSFYYFVRWTTEKRESNFFVAAGLVLPAAAFHSGTLAVLVGYIVIRVFYDNKREIVNIKASNILITLIIAFVAVFVISRSEGQFTGKFSGVDSLEDIANTNDMGRSSYAQYVGNSNNPVSFILFTPLRLFFFLFSPVPWMWRGFADMIAFFFSSLYYLIVIINVIKFLRTRKEKHRVTVIAFFIVAFAAVFVFAWGTSNAGTATRHRDKMLILFAILWALSTDGLQSVNRDRKRHVLGARV